MDNNNEQVEQLQVEKNEDEAEIISLQSILTLQKTNPSVGKLQFLKYGISLLGDIPEEYNKISSLNLSYNKIFDLSGIEGFRNLRYLNLAFNQLKDINNLYLLKSLENLNSLELQGNPIAKNKNYKSTIIQMIPSLNKLDGVPITEEDKQIANEEIQHQFEKLEELFQNYCTLILLQQAFKKVQVHIELVQVYNLDIEQTPFDVAKFLKNVDYKAMIDEDVKNDFKMNLIQDVHTIQTQLYSQDIKEAFEDLYNKQLFKISELSAQLKQAIQSFKSVVFKHKLSKSSDKKLNATKSQQQLEVSQVQSQTRESQQSQQKRLSQSPQLNYSQQLAQSQQKANNSTFQSYNSPQRNKQGVQQSQTKSKYQGSRTLNTSQGNNDTLMLSQRITSKKSQVKLQSSAKDLSASDLQQISQSLHFKTAAMKSYEKDRLIEELSSLLKQKIQELSTEQQNSSKLKQKVEEFQQVNQQNISIAEGKLLQQQEIIEKIKQDSDIQKSENQQLKDQIQAVAINKYDKSKLEDELNVAKQEIQYQTLYLTKIAELESKEEAALIFWKRRLLRQFFNLLQFATKKQKAIKLYLLNKKQSLTKNLLIKFFAHWQRFIVYNKIIASQKQLNSQNLLCYCLQQWKRNVKQLKLKKRQSLIQKKRLTLLFFCEWKQYLIIKRRRLNNKEREIKFRKMHLMKKCFMRLYLWKTMYQNDPYQECLEAKKSQQHFQICMMKKSFYSWKDLVQLYYVPIKARTKQSNEYYKQFLKSKSFYRWKSIKQIIQLNNKKADYFIVQNQKKLAIKIFDAWHHNFHQIITFKKKIGTNLTWIQQKKYFKMWKNSLQLVFNLKSKFQKMVIFYNNKLTKKVFGRMRFYWARNKALAKKFLKLQQISSQNRLRFFFGSFANNVRKKIEKRLLYKEQDNHFLKKFWYIFVNYTRRQVKYLESQKLQTLYSEDKKNKELQKIVKVWFIYTSMKKRDDRILKRLQREKESLIKWEFWAKLIESSRERLKFEILERQKQIENDQVLLDQQLEENKLLQSEKSKIQIEYQELVQSNEQQIAEAEDKEKLMEEIQRKYDETAQDKQKLDLDLEFKTKELKELEQKLEQAKNEILYSANNFEDILNQTKAQNGSLKDQLEEKSQELAGKEKEFQDSQNLLDKKLQQSEGIILEMNSRIDKQQGQVANLTESVQQKQQEILALVNNLKSINDEHETQKQQIVILQEEIDQNQQKYSIQIENLQDQLVKRSKEIEAKDQEMSQMDYQIKDLKSEIKKYQYEIELLKREQSGKTEEFIQQLKQQQKDKLGKLNNLKSSLNESKISVEDTTEKQSSALLLKSQAREIVRTESRDQLAGTEKNQKNINMSRNSSQKKLMPSQILSSQINKTFSKFQDLETPKTQQQLIFEKKASVAGKIRHKEQSSQDRDMEITEIEPDKQEQILTQSQNKLKSDIEERLRNLDKIMDSQISKIQKKMDENQ